MKMKKRKHNSIPIEIIKNESDKVVFFLIFKNSFALKKNIHVFLGNQNKKIICRRCLNSYKIENNLANHDLKCEQQELTTIRTSSAPHLPWKKKHFTGNPFYLKCMQVLKLILKLIILI